MSYSSIGLPLCSGRGVLTQQELSDLFRQLGAREPELWAQSQTQEKIPQLARFLFLRQAWKLVVDEEDVGWLSKMRHADPTKPGGDIGPAITRLLAAGGCEHDLTRVVRVMQWQLLSGLCQLLDDPGDVEKEVNEIAWRLFQVDESDRPIAVLGGLVESVLETEPTGREMRPAQN